MLLKRERLKTKITMDMLHNLFAPQFSQLENGEEFSKATAKPQWYQMRQSMGRKYIWSSVYKVFHFICSSWECCLSHRGLRVREYRILNPGGYAIAKAVLSLGSGDSFLETITIKCEALSVIWLFLAEDSPCFLGNPVLYANKLQSKSGGSKAG